MKLPECGNPKCRVSTGIGDELTFGSGELNSMGYWEFPCPICAKKWEDERLQERDKEVKDIMVSTGKSEKEAKEYLYHQHPFLFMPAWPD